MRAPWSSRQNCSHNAPQKLKLIRRFPDKWAIGGQLRWRMEDTKVDELGMGESCSCNRTLVGNTPTTAGSFRKKFRNNSEKAPEALSELFLEFPSRVLLGSPKPYNSIHCSGSLKCLELYGLGDPSRTLEGNSRKRSESVSGVFPEFFRNLIRKVSAVLGVWPIEGFLVAPYCAIPRDYLSDTPLLRAMGFLVSRQLGAIPPPPSLIVSLLGEEHAKWRCDTPPPQEGYLGYLSDTCAIPYKNKARRAV